MILRSRKWISVLTLFMGVLGCENPSGPGRELVPGIIFGFYEDDPQVTLALDGRALTVQVTSYGDGCRSKGEVKTTVRPDTRSARVAPFDWFTPDRICTSTLSAFEHSATFNLEAEGEWTILVAGDNIDGEPVEFEFTVVATWP